MSKKLIAGAGVVASLAVALAPLATFAADGTLSQTDTVVLTIDSACSLATSASGDITKTLANGGHDDNITGSTFTITCNDVRGWKLNAVGAGEATGDVTKMKGTGTGITSNDDIPTGTTLDGTVSNWAFKLAAGTGDHAGATIYTSADPAVDFTEFNAIPASATKVASGTTSAGTQTVTATYGIGVSPTQNAGTYTGKVQYTLVHPDA